MPSRSEAVERSRSLLLKAARKDALGWFALLWMLGLIGIAIFVQYRLPANVSAKVDPASVSNVWSNLREISRAPHPVGTQGHQAVHEFIVKRLGAIGADVQIQTNDVVKRYAPDFVMAAITRNILARVPGQTAGQALLVAAHYDSAPVSFGAADNGYAVSALLETARLLRGQSPPERDVIFLFSDAEELGLLGAESFLNHPWFKDVAMVLNFDARGSHGPTLLFETGRGNGMVQSAGRSGAGLIGVSLAEEVYRFLPNSTDFTVFRRANLPGLNFANIHGHSRYHTALDAYGNANGSTLLHVFDTASRLTRHFSSLKSRDNSSSLFFDIAGLVFVRYPLVWIWPITIVVLALTIAAIWMMARDSRRLTLVGILVGAFGQLAALLFSAALIFGIAWALRRMFGLEISGTITRPAYYFIAVAFLSLAAISLSQYLIIQRSTRERAAASALALWGALTLASTIWFWRASYLFAFMCLNAAVALILITKLRPERNPDLIAAVSLSPSLTLFGPTVALLIIAGGSAFVPAMAFIVALGATFPLFVCAWNNRSRLRAFSAVFAIAAGVLFAVGAWINGPRSNHPKAYSLAYVADNAAQSASLITFDQTLAGWQKPLFSPTSARQSLRSLLPWRWESALVAETPMFESRFPEGRVIADKTTNGIRRLSIEAQSRRGAHSLFLVIKSSGLTSIRFGQGPAQSFTGVDSVTLQVTGAASPCSFTMETMEKTPCAIDVFDQTHGLPASIVPARADITPARGGFSGSAFLRSSVAF